ncbi:MAG: relaxase/mobilization nuclease domain-containing protein [Desulfocapsaceae bacterium]|nr:relaxase/mobilization nuclease domain-containing protein [Desulfocapsaceae bacterium]
MKVFSHGTGTGNAAIHYLIRTDYPGREKESPEVVRGDPDAVLTIINSLDTKWKFTSGALSWHPDDIVSPQQEDNVIEDFERIAFAGLDRDAYSILWVRHSHAGHHELHFVIPRVELTTGKAFNPCPPGWHKDFDVFRDLHNFRENWARPDDPARRRLHTPEHAEIFTARLLRWGKKPAKDERAEAKAAIHGYVEKLLSEGLIHDRQDILTALQEIGFAINRAGKDYITVKDPESGEKIRLKGGIYGESWNFAGAHELPGGKTTDQNRTDPAGDREVDRRSVQNLEQELEHIIKKRTDYNRIRYRPRDRGDAVTIDRALQHGELAVREQIAANVFAGGCLVDGSIGGKLGIDGVDGQQGPDITPGNLRVTSDQGGRTANLGKTPRQDLGCSVRDNRGEEIHHYRQRVKNNDHGDHQGRATGPGVRINEETFYERIGTVHQKHTDRLEAEFRGRADSLRHGDGRIGEQDQKPGSSAASDRSALERVTELIYSLGVTIKAFEQRIATKLARARLGRRSGSRGR